MKTACRLTVLGTGLQLAAFASVAAAAPKVEETIIGPTNAGGAFIVAPQGAHVAYAGRKGDRYYVNVDGKEGPLFDELMKSSGSSYFFPAKAGVWRGLQGGAQGNDVPVVFSEDGRHHAYIGRQGDEYVVIHDGREAGRGPRARLTWGGLMGAITITPKGRHVFWNENETVQGRSAVKLVVDGRPGPASVGMLSASPVFSADESRYAYPIGQTFETGKQMLVLDGKDAGYLGQQPVFTADGSTLLTIGYEPGRSGVLANGKVVYPGSIKKLIASPAGRSWAAIATKMPQGGGLPVTILVIDGREVADTAYAQEVWFSPDGKRYAALCRNPYGNHPTIMVVDGKGGEFTRIDANPPQWTFDSSRVVYTGGMDQDNVVVVGEDVYPYKGALSGVFLPAAGNTHAFVTADNGTRTYSVVVGDKSVLPGGVYPVSTFLFSPDGSRYGYLVGPIGRGETTGIVIDGAIQPGITPGFFRQWISERQDALTPMVFSPDSKHVAFVGRTGGSPRHSVFIDGRRIQADIPSIPTYPAFTPDSAHFFWTIPEGPRASTLYVDGEQAVRANASFFSDVQATFAVDEDGTAAFLAEDGDNARRYRIIPGTATSVATLLETGTAVASATPPQQQPKPPPAAARPPVPAAPAVAATPASSARPAARPPAPAHASPPAAPPAPLVWADLVRRPETRPLTCTVNRDYKFQGGSAVRAGTKVNVLELRGGDLVVGTPDGRLNFGAKPEETDVLAVANAAWAALTPAQRELTYAALLRRQDLWPYNLKLLVPLDIDNRKTRVGEPVLFLGVEGSQLLVRFTDANVAFNVDAAQTDLMAQAREGIENEPLRAGRLLEEFAGKLVSPLDGRAVSLDAAARPKYVVLYRGAGWCGPCQQFSPLLVKLIQEKAPKPEDVTFLYISADNSPGEAKAYVTKLGIAWPTLYYRSRDQLPAFAPLFGDAIPQLIVTDRHGKILVDSARIGQQRALTQLQQML